MDGIYRVSGNLATIQKLRFIVDQGWSEKVLYALVQSSDTELNDLLLSSFSQRSTWTWITVSGKTSMLSQELSKCSLGNYLNHCSPSSSSLCSWMPSVSPARSGCLPRQHCTSSFLQVQEPHVNQVHLCLCTEMKDSKCKLQRMKKLIQELPKPNQDTMKVLFSHLLR